MLRPKGIPAKWSDLQTARWIRHLVRIGEVRFDDAGHAEGRGEERGISIKEMLDAVLLGVLVRRESHLVGKGVSSFDEERVTFKRQFNSHRDAALVVAGVSDEYPDCVIVTCMRKKSS